LTPAAGFGNVLHCTNIDQAHRHHARDAPSGCHLAVAEAQPGESDRSDMGMMILVAIAMVATMVVKGNRS